MKAVFFKGLSGCISQQKRNEDARIDERIQIVQARMDIPLCRFEGSYYNLLSFSNGHSRRWLQRASQH